MQDLVESTKQYVETILDVSLTAINFIQEKKLSLLIQNKYKIYEAHLLDETILLIIPREDKNQFPSLIKKHFFQIEEKTGLYPIYLCSEINKYARKELIKNRISFIVPDNQLYLPRLGVCLREYYKRKIVLKKKSLSTIAQLVLLYHFHNREIMDLSPSFLAEKLGYTTMSVLRAFREIESFDLGVLKKQGRKTIIQFKEKGERLWQLSLPILNSPVNKTISISSEYAISNEFIMSGLSLLSNLTMINSTSHAIYAMSLTLFNTLKKQKTWEILPEESTDKIELQLWRYTPALFTKGNQVDKLSLYLSFKDYADERIESALEELLEDFKW